MLSDGKTFVFPGMLYRKAFDLTRDDYPQNFEERIKFVYNFLEKEIPSDWQKGKEAIIDDSPTKLLLDNLLKQLDEI
jgi:hypothetical protein